MPGQRLNGTPYEFIGLSVAEYAGDGKWSYQEDVYNWETALQVLKDWLKSISLRDQLKQHPDRALRIAVWGMLPHNRMGRSVLKRLKIYACPDHPHDTNNPEPLA